MLDKLVQQLMTAKKDEAAANKKRIFIEEEIAKLVETADRGTKTVEAGEGFKVTVKRDMSYKVDLDALRQIDADILPLKPVPAVAATYKFDPKLYEELCSGTPELAKKFATCIEAKPKKTSITIKVG